MGHYPLGMGALLKPSIDGTNCGHTPVARTPMPEALLLGASTMAFLPCAGIMDSISGGIGVTKVSYHKQGLFFGQMLQPAGGMGFALSWNGFFAWSVLWNGFLGLYVEGVSVPSFTAE